MTANPSRCYNRHHLNTLGPKCLALFASGLFAAGVFAAADPLSQAPDPKCIEQEMKQGLDEAAAGLRCRNSPEPREEPVDMTVSSPPMISNDTGTPGPNNWELNFTVTGDLAADGKNFALPLLDINYGVGEKIQLTFEVPYSLSRTMGFDDAGLQSTTTLRGIGNAGASVKIRVYENQTSGVSLAFFPKLEFRLPGSRLEADGGTATRDTNAILPALLTWEFAHASFSANGGLEKSSADPRADYFASLGAGIRLTDRLAILGEIAGQQLDRGDAHRVLLNAGLRRKISGTLSLIASAGRDIRAGGDGQRHSYFNVTLQQLIEHKK
jgi:hypothetical protein